MLWTVRFVYSSDAWCCSSFPLHAIPWSLVTKIFWLQVFVTVIQSGRFLACMSWCHLKHSTCISDRSNNGKYTLNYMTTHIETKIDHTHGLLIYRMLSHWVRLLKSRECFCFSLSHFLKKVNSGTPTAASLGLISVFLKGLPFDHAYTLFCCSSAVTIGSVFLCHWWASCFNCLWVTSYPLTFPWMTSLVSQSKCSVSH